MKKILLVDDQEDILEILQIYIEGSFPEVSSVLATGGYEAIDILEEEHIDSIICDYRMPEGNGKLVYNYNITHKRLPFAWHSATFSTDCTNLVGFDSDNSIILSKPVEEEELIGAIEKMTREQTSSDSRELRKVRPSILRKFINFEIEVFIKMNDSKEVLINNSTTKLTKNILEKYETKGLEYFYIKDDDFKKMTSVLLEQLNRKIENCGTVEDIYFVNNDLISSFHHQIEELGVSPKKIELANSFANKCLKILNKEDNIKAMLSGIIDEENYISCHSLLTIQLASVLCPEGEEDLLEDISFASIVHDLKIKNERLAKIRDFYGDTFKKLSSSEREIVLNHGSDLIDQVNGSERFNTNVNNLLINHHFLSAKRKDFSVVNKSLALFLISHEIADQIFMEGIEAVKTLLHDLQEDLKDDVFLDILSNASNIFV